MTEPLDSKIKIIRGRNSIQNQIVRGFLGTTSLALLLTAGALFGSALILFQKTIDRDLTALAQVVAGTAEASLLFDDEKSAVETLNALKGRRGIVAAVVYDGEGEIFASYVRADRGDFRPPRSLEYAPVWSWNAIDLATRIQVGKEDVGSVFIRSDTNDLREFLLESIGIVCSVLLISIFLCGWGAARLRRRIADPLSLLADGSAEMAQGNLLARVEYEAEDEIGSVALAFNAMVFSLRGVVARVRENAKYVADLSNDFARASAAMADEASVQQEAVGAAGESVERIISSMQNVNSSVEALSKTALETSSATTVMDSSIAETGDHIDELSGVIETTASSVVEMTGAIREIAQSASTLNRSTASTSSALELMSRSVRQVETHAQESHALSDNTSGKAAQGMAAVHETVEGMQEIQASFQSMETIVNSLSEKSESIGAVVKVIQGVVEQTNLLALNAAIISAQAGEHGRAFSVVAEEVRNLAERTSRSTLEITDLLESVQDGIGGAVVAMGQSATRVDRGVGLATEAGRMLQEIGESAEQSTRRAKEIVGATRSQAADIGQVGIAMSQVESAAVQLGRGTHEQDEASTEITKGVERMRHLGDEVKRAAQQQRHESSLIAESVESVASRIREISVEINDQSKGADQIRDALKVFRETALRSATRAEQTTSTVNELADHAQGLEEEVGRFRTE